MKYKIGQGMTIFKVYNDFISILALELACNYLRFLEYISTCFFTMYGEVPYIGKKRCV